MTQFCNVSFFTYVFCMQLHFTYVFHQFLSWNMYLNTNQGHKPLHNSRTTKLDGPHSEHTCQIWIIKLRPNSWDPNYTPGVDFLGHIFSSSKNSGLDLSNEGSNFILSLLEVGHWVGQTLLFFEKFQILAYFSNLKQSKILNFLTFDLWHCKYRN